MPDLRTLIIFSYFLGFVTSVEDGNLLHYGSREFLFVLYFSIIYLLSFVCDRFQYSFIGRLDNYVTVSIVFALKNSEK